MKILKTTAIAAMLSCSMMTPANAGVTLIDSVIAQGASAETKTAMQAQCTVLAATHGAKWNGTLDLSSITASSSPTSGPAEVGTHTYATNNGSNRIGTGNYTPAHKEIEGEPYRNGGSVNMFGDQVSVGGQYASSTYDFTNTFKSTFAYSFKCNMTENVVVPALGFHEWTGPTQAADNAKQICEEINSGPHIASDRGANCTWKQTSPAGDSDEVRDPEAGIAVSQDQTEALKAHEDAGEGYFDAATQYLGQVAVCISPSKSGTKLPGSWTKQNGYTGSLCTNEWFNNGATYGVSNLNSGRHSIVTVPII